MEQNKIYWYQAICVLILVILLSFVYISDVHAYGVATGAYVPAFTKEIIAERTEDSIKFDNQNGSFTIRKYLGTQFIKNGNNWFEAQYNIPIEIIKFSPKVVLDFFTTKIAYGATATSTTLGDGYLTDTNPTLNSSTADFSYIGLVGADTINYLAKVTLPTFSGTITSASFVIHRKVVEGGSISATIHQVTTSPISNVDTSQATWNVSKTGTNWSTGGGDYGTSLNGQTITNDVGFTTFDITSATLTSGSDVAFIIKAPTTYRVIDTLESATANFRPYLEITYTPTATSSATSTASTATSTEAMLKGIAFQGAVLIVLMFLMVVGFMYNNMTDKKPWIT